MPGPVKLYRDAEFTKESDFIYCLASVDARGFTSNYSAQFRVTFDTFKNKINVELVSQSGAPKPYPNMYLNKDLFVDTMKDSGHSRLRYFLILSTMMYLNHNLTTYRVHRRDAWQETLMMETLVASLKSTEFLNLIADEYKIQIINVDNQLSKVINLSINDTHGTPMPVPINEISLSHY